MKKVGLFLFLILLYLSSSGQDPSEQPITFREHLALSWQDSNERMVLVAKNAIHAPIELLFFSKEDSTELSALFLPAKDSMNVLSYLKTKPDSVLRRQFSDSVRLSYFLGHPDVCDPDTAYLYRMPVKKGKKHRIMQSFYGSFSHDSDRSRYAIDFDLKTGQPIFAAREGIVVKAIDRFSRQGGQELIDYANQIVILHPDGTLAYYVHLMHKGCLVKEGQTVSKGEKIGYSGNTGYTTKPHLHFVVRKARNISIPIYFEGYEGEILKQGKKYRIEE